MSLLSERFLKYCEENNLDEVKKCLSQGMDVNTVSEDGHKWSGLHFAAIKNYQKLLDLLLSQPGIDVNLPTTTADNWTPLMYICNEGHHEMVRRLVQVPGINILYKDVDGNTALHHAAEGGNSECLEELAKVPGLDWNCKNDEGETPLDLASNSGYSKCVRIIMAQPGVDLAADSPALRTLFLDSCEENNLEEVKKYLNLGVDVNGDGDLSG